MHSIQLPETGFLRLYQILKLIPIGKSTWWAGVKSGRFPKQVKLGPRTAAWRVDDIRNLVDQYSATTPNKTGGGNEKI